MADKRRRLAARRRALGFTEEPLAERTGPGPEGAASFGLLSWVRADDEDDLNRRALLKLLGGAALAAPFAGHLEHLRRGLDAALGAPTSTADIEEWEHTASRYAREVGCLPPAQVFPALMADLAEVQTRLVRVPDALRPGMAHVSGQLSALMAIA